MDEPRGNGPTVWQLASKQSEHATRIALLEAAIKSHEEQLHVIATDIRAIKEAVVTARDVILKDREAEGKFRWTKLSVSLAAVSFVAFFCLNVYLAVRKP